MFSTNPILKSLLVTREFERIGLLIHQDPGVCYEFNLVIPREEGYEMLGILPSRVY